jgi:multiple sugar transport system permease protein
MQPPAGVRIVAQAATWLVALTMLLPLAWMVGTALKGDREAIAPGLQLLPAGLPTRWHWENFAEAWRQAGLGDFYANSLIVAVAVTLLSVAHNALAGFAFAKLHFAGRRLTFALTLATMLLPMQVYFIFAYVICGWLGYLDSLQGLTVPFLASAFGIFYMRQSISAVPDSLLAAGRLDGMSDLELFLHVVAPAVAPALGALAIFTFMASWNNFFWPLVVIDSEAHVTLPLAVARLSAGYYVSSWPVQMAAATIITMPTIVVFLIFQRRFTRGLALTGGKG